MEGKGWEKERERRLKRAFPRWLEAPGRETKRRREPRGGCFFLTRLGYRRDTEKPRREIFQNPRSEIADGNVKIG